MGLLSQNSNDINNELSAVLRVIRTHYHNEIKLQIASVNRIKEFKLKIVRKNYGYYKFLFIIKIPKEYPYEPLWAEPVIVSKEMRNQFNEQEFRCFKLRPLIDELLAFCHKYDTQNLQSLQISFPATRLYGEKEISTKVFILFNKALSKFNTRYAFDMPNNTNDKRLIKYQLIQNSDYYNDMGMSMVNYVNMLNNLTLKTEQKNFVEKNYFIELNKSKHFVRSKLRFTPTKEIKRHISRTLFSKMSKKYTGSLYKRHLKDLKFCKINLSKVKIIIDPFTTLLKTLSDIDSFDDFFIEIVNDFLPNQNVFHDVLSIKYNVLNEFRNLVEYSFIKAIDRQFNIKCVSSDSNLCQAVVPMHCREIIPANYLYNCIEDMLKFIRLLNQIKDNSVDSIYIYLPVKIVISENNLGFIEESFSDEEIEFYFIPNTLINNIKFHIYKTLLIKIEKSVFSKQSFLKTRIAAKLMLNSDFRNSSKLDGKEKSLMIFYVDILSEVIQYPKIGTSFFEYTLELNPQSNRHKNILDNIGFKHISQFEIVAPTDYNLHLFFIKEISNPHGLGNIIKLHKLITENLLFKLIADENNYLKNLLETNKSVWCSGIISNSNFDLVKMIFNVGKMYLQKIKRRKQMKIEAEILNCKELTIQRYHFSKELVESLSIFSKKLAEY